MQSNKSKNRVCVKSNAAAGFLLKKLAVEVLGAENVLTDPGLLVYQLTDGTLLEIYNTQPFHSQDIFNSGNTVVSFQVRNVEESVAQMLNAGAKTVDGIIRLNENYAYCHLIFADDQIVGLHEIHNG